MNKKFYQMDRPFSLLFKTKQTRDYFVSLAKQCNNFAVARPYVAKQ